ncbi:hypothetical protein D3C86_1048710 [compost metagenome]
MVVDHGADLTGDRADHEVVADLEGAVLDEHRGDGPHALVELRLDDEALGHLLGVGLELEHLGDQQDHLEQVLEADLLLGRDGDHDGLTAPLLGDQLVLGQLLLDLVGVGAGLVDLVDGDQELDAGFLGVADGLDGLGLDAVVGRHHQDRDVGRLGAAGAHGGERLVARGVEEGDELVVDLDLVGADVLGDAAGLARGDAGLADGVQQGGLTVVDVTHDGDDGRTGQQVGLVLDLDLDGGFLFHGVDQLEGVLHLGHDHLGGLQLERLVDGRHDPLHEEALDDLGLLDAHLVGELLDRDGARELDVFGQRGQVPCRFCLVAIASTTALATLAAGLHDLLGVLPVLVLPGVTPAGAAMAGAGTAGAGSRGARGAAGGPGGAAGRSRPAGTAHGATGSGRAGLGRHGARRLGSPRHAGTRGLRARSGLGRLGGAGGLGSARSLRLLRRAHRAELGHRAALVGGGRQGRRDGRTRGRRRARGGGHRAVRLGGRLGGPQRGRCRSRGLGGLSLGRLGGAGSARGSGTRRGLGGHPRSGRGLDGLGRLGDGRLGDRGLGHGGLDRHRGLGGLGLGRLHRLGGAMDRDLRLGGRRRLGGALNLLGGRLLHGRGGVLADVLDIRETQVVQHRDQVLALDVELLGQFVYPHLVSFLLADGRSVGPPPAFVLLAEGGDILSQLSWNMAPQCPIELPSLERVFHAPPAAVDVGPAPLRLAAEVQEDVSLGCPNQPDQF